MRIFTLLTILLGSFFYAQTDSLKSQYEVIYRVKLFSDTLNKNNALQEDLSLLIKGQKSIFKSTKKAIKDSILMAEANKSFDNPVDGKVILDFKNVPNVVFKSEVLLDKGQQTVYKDLLGSHLSYPLDDFIHWKIESETQMIGSYLCKKATGKYKKRDYIAWFTEKIPIPDGPYIFKGLPGLILEVYDKKDYYNFSMISIKEVAKPMVLMENVFATKYSNFQKARQAIIDNSSGAVSRQTGYSLKPNDASKINENVKRANNYID